jgi:hypothetical protein
MTGLDPLQKRFAIARLKAAMETVDLCARRGLVKSRQDGVNQCRCRGSGQLARNPECDSTVFSVGLSRGLGMIG